MKKRIYIYSPSSAVRDKASFKRGIKRLQALGYDVEIDTAALSKFQRFAGDDETRLAAIRLKYEPYSQALARYLLIDLPPWILSEKTKDNWKGGPWDKQLGSFQATTFRADEHF